MHIICSGAPLKFPALAMEEIFEFEIDKELNFLVVILNKFLFYRKYFKRY